MKKISFMLLSLCLTALLASCEQPIPEDHKDWAGTTTGFASSDEKISTTYY